jgi:hypothetical protein
MAVFTVMNRGGRYFTFPAPAMVSKSGSYGTAQLCCFRQNHKPHLVALIENEGLSERQTQAVHDSLSQSVRNLSWQYPLIRHVNIFNLDTISIDRLYSELRKLTEPSALYRLPQGFPVINFLIRRITSSRSISFENNLLNLIYRRGGKIITLVHHICNIPSHSPASRLQISRLAHSAYL